MGAEWDHRMKAMVDRLKEMTPAPEPFEISPGAAVFDPVKFHAVMLEDAAIGPKAPRCRTGAFQQDLERYLKIRGEQWDTKSAKPATAGD